MTISAVILFLLLFLLFFENREGAVRSEYQIRFGIVEEVADGEYDVCVETRSIPLFVEDTGFIWGYTVGPPDENYYTTSEVLYLPSPPKRIEFSVPIEKKEGGRIIRTASMPRRYQSISVFRFSEGDPLGDWRLQVYVNDLLVGNIRFTVVRPRAYFG